MYQRGDHPHEPKLWRGRIQIIMPVAASTIPVTNAAKHENSRKSSSTRPMAQALNASVWFHAVTWSFVATLEPTRCSAR